jgi:predicted dienelactone hydrolase
MRFVPALLLLAATACASDPAPSASDSGAALDDSVDPLSWPAAEPGPYQLGYLLTEATYTTALGEPHTVPVHVWYPTQDTTGAAVRYEALFAHEAALGGAAPAPPVHDGGYPVMVQSHGHFGVAGAVAYWADRLVSQGWVVIAPDHVGNTFQAGFPDFSEPSPTVHYIERPGDVSAALDHVATADLLAGPLQTDAVALSGHSRGAYTVWAAAGARFDPEFLAAACAGENGAFPTGACTADEQAAFASGALADPRFQASLVLDGGIRDLFGETGHAAAHTPFLTLRKSASDPDAQAEFDRMDPLDYTWVSVEGACHETFNLGVEASTLQPCDTFEVERGWHLTATYAAAFFRHHLLGDDAAETVGVLDGSIAVDAAATLRSR